MSVKKKILSLEKGMEKARLKLLSHKLVTGVVGVLVIGTVAVLAFSGSATNVVEECNNCNFEGTAVVEPEYSVGDEMLGGASRFPNSYIYAGLGYFTDPNQGYNHGTFSGTTDVATTTNGWVTKMFAIDLNSTTSAALLNPENEPIFVVNAYLRIQTATTTNPAGTAYNIAYFMGTSSVALINPDDSCGVTASTNCALASAHEASILQTGALATTTAKTTYFKYDYEGTDTRDGSGTRYVVPVLEGEYITCYASSTTLYKGGKDQAAQCVVEYYLLKD